MVDSLAEDRQACAHAGWVDVGDETGLEALAQAILQGLQVSWGSVRGEHQLGSGFVEGVEGVEELLLGAGLALEELDVVDEQDVHVAEARLEGVHATFVQGCLKLVGEGLAGAGADAQAGIVAEDHARDRAQEVGLADPRRTADEEWVVGLSGELGNGQSGGVGEPVAVADDEVLEAVPGIAEGIWRPPGLGLAREISSAAKGEGAPRGYGRGWCPGASRRASCLGCGRLLAGHDVDRDVGSQDGGGAGVKQSPEAFANPPACLWR